MPFAWDSVCPGMTKITRSAYIFGQQLFKEPNTNLYSVYCEVINSIAQYFR